MYIKQTVTAGKTIEVKKYYSYRFHNPGKRKKASKPTPEAQKKLNQRKAEDRLTWLMNGNFEDGDYHIVLSNHLDPPKSIEEFQKRITNCIRKLRRINPSIKYIYVKEIGPKGSKHVHMVIKGVSLEEIKSAWPFGSINAEPLYTKGQYRKLASYFVKYALKTEQTELSLGEKVGKRWYASQNLTKPKIKREIIFAHKFREEPKIPRGYYLDKESEQSGVSEYTGYEYYTYTLIKGP